MPTESQQGARLMEQEMNWVLSYLAPPAILAYAIRVEWMFKKLTNNTDMQELIHYMRWLASEQTGKTPPPYVK